MFDAHCHSCFPSCSVFSQFFPGLYIHFAPGQVALAVILDTRYFHVVAALDSQTATRALSVKAYPLLTKKYETLKSFLCSAFGLSETVRANTLLDLSWLGDRKPSELTDSMLALVGDHKPCFILKQIFLRQLPEKVRVPLANSPITELRMLSLEADRILDSLSPECNSSVSAK